jgi:hypothetical protein
MTDSSTPAPNPYPDAPVVPAGGGAGRAAFILAIVLVVFGVVLQVVAILAPHIAYNFALNSSGIGAIFTVTTIVSALISVVVVVLGAIGVQPSQPRGRLAAAAALAIGASHLLAALVSFIAPAVLYAVL